MRLGDDGRAVDEKKDRPRLARWAVRRMSENGGSRDVRSNRQELTPDHEFDASWHYTISSLHESRFIVDLLKRECMRTGRYGR